MKTLKIPQQIEKLVRIYESEEKVADYLTVVFAKPFFTEHGVSYFSYIGMNERPFHPSHGIGQHGESRGEPIDRKNGLDNSAHLGKRIYFKNLNSDCQKMIMQDFVEEEK